MESSNFKVAKSSIAHIRRTERTKGDVIVVEERHRLRYVEEGGPALNSKLLYATNKSLRNPSNKPLIHQQRPEINDSSSSTYLLNNPWTSRQLGRYESRDDSQFSLEDCVESNNTSGESTPLRTPVIERLETPDIPDLKFKCFCECCEFVSK